MFCGSWKVKPGDIKLNFVFGPQLPGELIVIDNYSLSFGPDEFPILPSKNGIYFDATVFYSDFETGALPLYQVCIIFSYLIL